MYTLSVTSVVYLYHHRTAGELAAPPDKYLDELFLPSDLLCESYILMDHPRDPTDRNMQATTVRTTLCRSDSTCLVCVPNSASHNKMLTLI